MFNHRSLLGKTIDPLPPENARCRHWLSVLFHALTIVGSYSLLYTVFFSPVIFAGRLLAPGDGIDYYLLHHLSKRTLWEPILYAGFPMAADPQAMSWYPVSLLLSHFPDSGNVFVMSAFVLASCFTYGYVYTLTHSRLSGLVSGITYGMSSALVDRLMFTTVVHTVAWLPLVLWALEQVNRRKERLQWAAIAVVAIAFMFLAGNPQSFIYAMGLVIAYVLVIGFRAGAKLPVLYLFCRDISSVATAGLGCTAA